VNSVDFRVGFFVFLVVGSIHIRVHMPGTILMRCGRISVKGEAEEIAVSPGPRSRQKHGKRSNPYSTGGLDKFESVYAELSAKREYIAKKTGTPDALVRFLYSKNGWIPVVVRPREGNRKKNCGVRASRASILGPVEKNHGEKDGELRREDKGNDINGGSESISISGFDERSHSLVMPSSQFLKITVFGFLGLRAMWTRRSAVFEAMAMAVVMAVGGVMCMKKFILSRVSYFSTLFRNNKASQNGGGVEEIAEQKDVYKLSRRTPRLGHIVSAPSSPLRAHLQPIKFSASASASPRAAKQKTIDPEHKHHQSKAKKFRRVVSMENRPTRTARLQGSDSFYRRTSPAMAIDTSVGATVMIITLLCLVFYGRLCAIFFTSAWWYLLSMLVAQRTRGVDRNNNSRMVDLQSNEYKMKVIMNGFLERKHN